jgi:ABC-type dipeptide/oligopeptide/nickel transport system permease component
VPGIGLPLIDFITYRDYPMVQGAVLMLTTMVVASNLVADVVYGLPRCAYPLWRPMLTAFGSMW